ncbi:TonB-dependent receptor [Alicycliphilus denitrificans]|uniref:TonB-dependent receptor n=1 Tax=Alicycliphilus denitrificans TaxID=179636 RepID=A0A3R7EGU4_9BURK|nr:TonB-dependent receptor [Alicycliphilus denitrificans]RKJ99455.1 TonB-dependent receptor [Alicycliphilus denitrificans]
MAFRQPRLRALAAALASLAVLAETSGAWAQDDPEGERATPALPTVVISGSKRDQRLDSLNGAASVAERTELEDAQAASTLDLARVFPDLTLSYSGSQLFPIVTLRGVTSAQDFYNPALTVYVDGVPQLPVSAIQSLVDVERVELLKGPQGTLYGKSAQGGVLNIVTHQPDDTPQGIVRGGFSSHGGYQAQANVSGPLVRDLLYGSVSLAGSKVPGELDSPLLGDGVGGVRSQVGNFKLRLAPTGSPWEMGLSGGRDCANGKQDVYAPYDEIGSRTAYVMDGVSAEFHNVRQRRCVNAVAARGQYQWDDWQLSAVVSGQRLSIEREFLFGPQYSWQPERWRQNTQELRLSTRPRDPQADSSRNWDGVFGLYRQQVNQSRHYTIDMVAPARAPFLDSQSRNTGESISAYGDVTWYVVPQVDLSAGLRVSRDRAETNFAGDLMGTPVAGDRAVRQNTWLGRIGAGYRFAPQWRGYVNVAQGYKPAGYALAPTSAADAEGFERERSTSYEIGARYTSGSLRLGLAAYRVDTRDAQLYGDSNMGYQTLKNVGDTRSTGLEFSADWDATRDWTLGATGFISDAKFRRYTDSSACTDCNGNHVPLVPAHGLTLSAKGRVRLGDTVLRPRIAARHVGAHYFDTANTLRQGGYTLIDAGLAWMPVRGLEVAFYVNNLADKDYRTYGFSYGPMGSFAQVGTGRTMGVTLTYAY